MVVTIVKAKFSGQFTSNNYVSSQAEYNNHFKPMKIPYIKCFNTYKTT